MRAIGDGGVPFYEIARAMGRHVDVPTKSIPPDEIDAHSGFLAPMVTIDSPASADITRKLLGWEPTGPSLLEDLEQGHYFRQQ